MRIIASEADIQEGIAHLGDIDQRLQPVIARAGEVPLRRNAPGFGGLCKVIVSQQLSVASASAIWNKTTTRLGALEPAALLAAGDDDLRACGLSAPKMRTLRAIAEAAEFGRLPLDIIADMPISEAIARMTAVKGIGPWTAEIYLMFNVGHADVFPAGDLALQEAVRIAFSYRDRPSAKALAEEAARWAPWRAVAARLFWAYYRQVKSREGVT